MGGRVRLAVPSSLRSLNPSSGVGNMWRHVLGGLAARTDLRYLEPAARGFARRRPHLWLSDCGFGALPVTEPVVVQVHEAGWDDDDVRATLDPHFLEVVLEGRVGDAVRAATRVITPSESARAQVIRHWSVAPDRVHAVPHGVDAGVFRPGLAGAGSVLAREGGDPDRPYVLFVSQLHPRKNVGVLRAAMQELVAAGLPHQLVLVGGPAQDRPDSRELLVEATAELPGTPGRVVAIRDLPEPELATVIAGAGAFCLPSLMEGFGMTALEAMSCGVPVVVSDRGSLPEVVGDGGLVVAPRVDAVRDALAAVLTDRELATTLASAGRARAEAFTWERTVSGWYDVLERARAAAPR